MFERARRRRAGSGFRSRANGRRTARPRARLKPAAKGATTVTVAIPTKECGGTIAGVLGATVAPLRRAGLVDDVLVIDAGSQDGTAARALINLHVPLLAGFAQPLAGEFAARRTLLEALPFPVGYGVEIAVMIDSLNQCGLDALAECHLGTRQNRHQPLRALGEMAFAVLAAVENRLPGPRSPTGGHYVQPWENGAVINVPIDERPPLRSLVHQAA